MALTTFVIGLATESTTLRAKLFTLTRRKALRQVWNRLFGRKCEHTHTLVVNSVGVRRTVCENCGHISFKMLESGISRMQSRPTREAELPKVSGL